MPPRHGVLSLSTTCPADLALAVSPELLCGGRVQLSVQGTGEPAAEAASRMAQIAQPARGQVHISYDEARAHRLIADSHAIVAPSRFEP